MARKSVIASPTCMSHWWPKIQGLGLDLPKTVLVKTDVDLVLLLDGQLPAGFDDLVVELQQAAETVGPYPVFLRTGLGSGKHDWSDTCFVPSADQMGQHVFGLTEWSHCVDFFGLATDVWAVREMLPTRPLFTAFGGMPIVREARFFVEGDKVLGWHPYWPAADTVSYGTGTDPGFERHVDTLHQFTPAEIDELSHLTRMVGKAVPGAWSVDWLDVQGSWYLTDMAEAKKSFVWADWPDAPAL